MGQDFGLSQMLYKGKNTMDHILQGAVTKLTGNTTHQNTTISNMIGIRYQWLQTIKLIGLNHMWIQ
jgi:hypothetical protein